MRGPRQEICRLLYQLYHPPCSWTSLHLWEPSEERHFCLRHGRARGNLISNIPTSYNADNVVIVGLSNNVSTYAQILGARNCNFSLYYIQFISEGITNFSDSSSSENIRVPSIQSISSSVQSPQILHNPVQHETLTWGSYCNETLTDYLNSKGIRPLVKFCLVVHPKNLSLQTLKN